MTNATKRAGWRMMIGASMLTIASMGTAPLAAQSAEDWAQMRADGTWIDEDEDEDDTEPVTKA